jgi:hypothetical protein
MQKRGHLLQLPVQASQTRRNKMPDMRRKKHKIQNRAAGMVHKTQNMHPMPKKTRHAGPDKMPGMRGTQ